MLAAVLIAMLPVQLHAEDAVQEFLKDHPEAEELYAAYVEFLDDDSPAATAERNLTKSLDDRAARRVFNEFQRALGENPDLAQAKEKFDRFLANDPEARAFAEQIYEARHRYGIRIGKPAQGYHQLRSHLDRAAEYLGDDADLERPAGVDELIAKLDETPGARTKLRQAFEFLAKKPGAVESLTPYWKNAVDMPAARQWEGYLGGGPDPTLWRKAIARDVHLADQENVRAGVAQLHRVVGGDPDLVQTYMRHVREIAQDDDARTRYLQQWRQRHGTAPKWPHRVKKPGVADPRVRKIEGPRQVKKPTVRRIGDQDRSTARRLPRPDRPERPPRPGKIE